MSPSRRAGPFGRNIPWSRRECLGASAVGGRASVKIVALELFTIDLLKRKKAAGMATQLKHVWTELRNRVDEIVIEDPANPTGNDLWELLSTSVRVGLSEA